MKTATPKKMKGRTAFDVEVAYYADLNADIATRHEDATHRRILQQEYERWLAFDSPRGRVKRYYQAHEDWCASHPMPTEQSHKPDEPTPTPEALWFEALKRGDARAYAADRCGLIDPQVFEHFAWWMRLDEQDVADLFWMSVDIIADDISGSKKWRDRPRTER